MTKKKPTTKRPTRSKPDLPELLAAVLSHPDLPHFMWDAITDALSEQGMSTDIYENPDVLRLVFFGESKPKRGGAR
jgi:hypothetical protein